MAIAVYVLTILMSETHIKSHRKRATTEARNRAKSMRKKLCNYENQLNKLELIFWPIVKVVSFFSCTFSLILWHVHAVYGLRCQHILFQFIVCTEIKILLCSVFWWAHVSPEKDLILFSIKRHWTNCFLFLLAGELSDFNLLLSRPNPLRRWQQPAEYRRIGSSKNYAFIFMHIHRIVSFVLWLKTYCIRNCNGVLIFMQFHIRETVNGWMESTAFPHQTYQTYRAHHAMCVKKISTKFHGKTYEHPKFSFLIWILLNIH